MAMDLERRRCLAGLIGATGFVPGYAGPRELSITAPRCVAAWDSLDGQHWVGVLEQGRDQTLEVRAAQSLPTRAHGLSWEADGRILVVARRPGEWLLRWDPEGRHPLQWQWLSGPRVLGGHVLVSPDGPRIYTIEQDGDTAEGWLVARDRHSLAEQAAWPTGGLDPHMALADGSGHALVANGGVPPAPWTRRSGPLRSSLVRLDLRNGALAGRWTLPDASMSLRHLARHADGQVGVALQCEHLSDPHRMAAPLLAIFDGQRLQAAEAVPHLGGYGGDIAADPLGFLVSASRAPLHQGGFGAVAHWRLDGQCHRVSAWPQAGALGRGWAAGKLWQTPESTQAVLAPKIKAWDNHLGGV
ncbi:MAG: DUF1513 domain-containing protein [Ideonella sp.]|nr:DUF1513 domain-containing protein [Ideonella sp.]